MSLRPWPLQLLLQANLGHCLTEQLFWWWGPVWWPVCKGTFQFLLKRHRNTTPDETKANSHAVQRYLCRRSAKFHIIQNPRSVFRGTDFCPRGSIWYRAFGRDTMSPNCLCSGLHVERPYQWVFLQLRKDIHSGSDVWAGNLESKRCCQITRNSDLQNSQFGLENKSTCRINQHSYSSSEPQGTALPKHSAPFPLKLWSCQSSNRSNMKEYPTVADELVHAAFSLSWC